MLEGKVLSLLKRRSRPLHSLAFAVNARGKPMFPSWPALKKTLISLQAKGKIEMGLKQTQKHGERLYIYLAGRMPENVRSI